MATPAPDSIPKFFDENERPPQGGWHYFTRPDDRSTYFRLSSSSAVFEEVKKYRRNNGTFVSDIDIWRELWAYWCGRQPGRCGLEEVAPSQAAAVAPRELNPPFWGPIIWRAMNLYAVRFDAVGRDSFLRFLTTCSVLMTCPECIGHWQQILAEHSPAQLATSFEACQWVNKVHNLVNARRGVAQYPYDRMVTEYGAPLS
jgi:hypothetical protein